MPRDADQLRQLLTERSDPARYHPAPQERIATRIRRARTRRVAVAGVMAVAAVAAVLSVASLPHGHASGHSATPTGQQFPASFTASDGAYYTRLAVTSLAEPAQKSATVTIRAGQDPIDVMATCDAPGSNATVNIAVNRVTDNGFGCPGKAPQLIGLAVPPDHETTITFTKFTEAEFPTRNTDWQFAVYEWKPPAVARSAPAVPRLPLSYIGYNTTTGRGKALRRLIASRSGDWPADRTAVITVHADGHNLDISLVCSGAIANRLQVTMRVSDNGQTDNPVPCTSSTPSEQEPGTITLGGAPSGKLTITFRIQAPSSGTAAAYAKRAASWAIGVYEEEY